MKWLKMLIKKWSAVDDIPFGFILIVLAFLIPGVFLFYFTINFKMGNIRSTQKELNGTYRIDEEILYIQGRFPNIVDFYGDRTHITRLGQESALPLDNHPNSHYMVVLTSYATPSVLELITKMRSQPEASIKRMEYTDQLDEMKDRMDTWLSIARLEDEKINGLQSEFQERFQEERDNLLTALDSIIDSEGTVTIKDINNVFRFWSFSNSGLRMMLEKRLAFQKGELFAAIGWTVLVWLTTMGFTFWFSQRLTKKRKLLQEQVRQQDQTLSMASKMTALGELAGNIAHEVNTPLGAIRLNAELIEQLVREDPIPARQIETLASNLNRTVDKISQIISSMLKYARSDSSDTFTQIDLSNIFEEALMLTKENVSKKSIDLKMNIEPHLEILCRPNEILQVILNLIKNSIDAVESLSEKWIRIDAFKKGDRVIFSVTDSGLTRSIPDPQKIFTPFYSTKPIGQGTGLGLGISRRLIESHQGTLQLDLTSRHTCFVIDLPSCPTSAIQPSPPPHQNDISTIPH